MDFIQIRERSTKRGCVEVYPDFMVRPSKDLMVRGGGFYAIWDEEIGLWSTKEYDVARLVDKELYEYRDKMPPIDGTVTVRSLSSFTSKSWIEYKSYVSKLPDNFKSLDEQITFSNSKVTKKDHVSMRLPYPLEAGSITAYDTLIGTLYDEEERAKLEWAIGAVVSGESKNIQKFIVLYGEAGTGKSTILNIIQKMFEGYYTTFEAKSIASSNNQFSTEVFKSNPIIGIQHDGDLSKIEDNTKLNSIISHEQMSMNEKFKAQYTSRTNSFLFMGTNKPVKITDAKSGIIRRLIDVKPSGRKVPSKQYHELMARIDFELGAIAYHCLELYTEMGANYYSSYRPLGMMFQTDAFFNFVEASYETFEKDDGVGLSRAYDMYVRYCDDSNMDFKLPRYKFREELKNYFSEFLELTRIDGKQVRNGYVGFKKSMFKAEKLGSKEPPVQKNKMTDLVVSDSLLDQELADCKAQYASETEKPLKRWASVTTKLSDLDTSRLHYLQVPSNHIVIDFDLRDDSGNKSSEKNLEAISKWPPTYAEYSKGGAGIHLHYIYDGDVSRLASLYDDGIEIKAPIGDSSIRRRMSKCNGLPIATIKSGLPLKGERMVNSDSVKSERSLRNLIKQNLTKDFLPGTKPSVDFIHKILEDAYTSGLHYDVTDMRPSILAFANNSTNQADYCIKMVGKMKFKSEEISEPERSKESDEMVFFDVEVFPNLFVVVWKVAGPDRKCVRMINPSPSEIEDLMRCKLVGFNCRRYDNHILYARYVGKSNSELYILSQRIIGNSPNAMTGEAFNLSYTDVFDFASAGNKKSLKKFEIELKIHHQELGLPWDKPVPEDLWELVAEYCENDVVATEAVFNHLKGDWTARQILADLSGLTVNDTTNEHTKRIVFGTNKKPQNELVYTDLSTIFPGYSFSFGKSTYRGEDPGEGGYVCAEPGVYFWVPIDDVESMHPTSIEELNLLGPYTKIYSDMKKARLAIKHNDREALYNLLDGSLLPFVARAEAGEFSLKDLSTALKTALNSAYGLTSAKFDNQFRDPRNVDNIVAKRGALFMIDLKHEVLERGFTVAHIKTDSIKIPEATPEILSFVYDFGLKYGYKFEHEATYRKMCLVNDAVYIAQYATEEECLARHGYVPKECKAHPGEWTATGAQFAHPYVFKTLFTHEPLVFEDLCETKSVSTALYLDMNENLPDVSEYERAKKIRYTKTHDMDYLSGDRSKISKADWRIHDKYILLSDEELDEQISRGHDYRFVGKVGQFCPVVDGSGGGMLSREKDGKFYAATGSKGYRWQEAETVNNLQMQDKIDLRYFEALANDAKAAIDKYCRFDRFVDDSWTGSSNTPPWTLPCGDDQYQTCHECPRYQDNRCLTGYDLKNYIQDKKENVNNG